MATTNFTARCCSDGVSKDELLSCAGAIKAGWRTRHPKKNQQTPRTVHFESTWSPFDTTRQYIGRNEILSTIYRRQGVKVHQESIWPFDAFLRSSPVQITSPMCCKLLVIIPPWNDDNKVLCYSLISRPVLFVLFSIIPKRKRLPRYWWDKGFSYSTRINSLSKEVRSSR